MTYPDNAFHFFGSPTLPTQVWEGPLESVAFDDASIRAKLLHVDQPCYVVGDRSRVGVTNDGQVCHAGRGASGQLAALIAVPPLPMQQLGDANFLAFHRVKYAYTAGSMANGIASEELVMALGKEGILSSFGAAGLTPSRIEAAIHRLQQALPQGPYAFNLIHSPSEEALERKAIDLYLKYGITTVEASAFLDLTPPIVYYRAAGLGLTGENRIEVKNKIIAKVSRREVAIKFLQPAPVKILRYLVEQKLITELQATLAEKISMADDITVEADSAGHTDNRPLVCLLPSILALRDEIQEQYHYPKPVRVGAAGGIGTPSAALAAFMMGAAYVTTGSINQSCVEAAASSHTKNLLAQAGMADVIMAPAADMFEMGVKVQVLKRGTFFPMRAQKLFDLYRNCNAIEDIPAEERDRLEQQIFRRNLESVWEETVAYFSERDPEQIARATHHPKRKMALIFRWYLGLSSRWSNVGEANRETDYQIWCGPAMGSFNDWVKGSYLADPQHRRVGEVARHIMTGAAFLMRLHQLKLLGLQIPARYAQYRPVPFPTAMGDNRHHQPLPPPPPGATLRQPQTAETVQAWLVFQLAERLGVSADDIDIREPFNQYNLDSAQALVLLGKLEKWLGRRLSPVLLWNYPTIAALAEYVAEEVLTCGPPPESRIDAQQVENEKANPLERIEQLSEEEVDSLFEKAMKKDE